MFQCYSAYGLTIASELVCPELLPAAEGAEPDVTVSVGRVPERIDAPVRVNGPIQIGHGVFQLLIDGVARYRTTGGRRIVVDPLPGAAEADVRLHLLGTVFGAALHMLGRLPLHAGSVAVDGRAYAFCGDSGAGKSTLSAALHRRGLPTLCDDVGVVAPEADGTVRFFPGFPRLKLWRDTLDHFGIDPRPLVRDRTRTAKYHLRLRAAFHSQPLPLAGVYLLDRAEADAPPTVEPLTRYETIATLIAHTYRRALVRRIGDPAGHLHQCARIAARVAGYRFRRPWSLARLDESAERLLEPVRRGRG